MQSHRWLTKTNQCVKSTNTGIGYQYTNQKKLINFFLVIRKKAIFCDIIPARKKNQQFDNQFQIIVTTSEMQLISLTQIS